MSTPSLAPLTLLHDSSHQGATYAIHSRITCRSRLLPYSYRKLSNLISIPSLPPVPRGHTTKMYFRYINVHNLKNKSAYFFNHTSEHAPDITAIIDTWLTTKDNAVRVECTPPGYNLLDQLKQIGRQCGGLTLLIRDLFTV